MTDRKKKSDGREQRRILYTGIGLLILVVGGFALILSKAVNFNRYIAAGYELCGIDVSHYQGDIDWQRLGNEKIDFAFIKATEGSSYVDEKFAENWRAAEQTDLYIGAYHFFSFDSEGRIQADWYIQTVGELSGRLAPVVDVEYYGDKEANPPSKEQVTVQLKDFLNALEEHYLIKPIIYTTYTVYHRYIEDEFQEYPLWIRNVYYSPDIDLNGKWQFWQYTDRAVLEGYEGTEKYIDLNVFRGSEEELRVYMVPDAEE